eukprot:UN18070
MKGIPSMLAKARPNTSTHRAPTCSSFTHRFIFPCCDSISSRSLCKVFQRPHCTRV